MTWPAGNGRDRSYWDRSSHLHLTRTVLELLSGRHLSRYKTPRLTGRGYEHGCHRDRLLGLPRQP